jgi:CRISPR/Cas system CMR subunit Cmr6 (Cas7 group RAMP superfamily)
MAKTTPWNKIKADYLNGVTPKELAKKYSLTPKQIHDKANRDSWVKEKTSIAEKTREDVQERIKELTNLALETLCEVIKADDSKYQDKVSASKAILDVSGLKSLKQEIEGIGGMNVIINREAVHVESNN